MSTVIIDPAETFPGCPTYGFTAAPNYLVKITKREGGYERVDRKWSRPLTDYTGVPTGDQPEEDIERILNFWHAMGGMSTYFRFKDWVDYRSCFFKANVSALDQPILASGDSPASYQLVKQYVAAKGTTQLREIMRPIGSTILVANETGTLQSDWTLDESTGILTPGGSFSGTPHSWGGEFDVWVRFDAIFNPSISNYQIMNATCQLTEKRVKPA